MTVNAGAFEHSIGCTFFGCDDGCPVAEELLMRPTYETEADRDVLESIVARLQRTFGGKFSPVPSGLNYKRFRTDGELEDCWIVKRRKYTQEQLNDLGGYMLALKKWEAGLQCSRDNDCQFNIALQLEDGLFVASFAWPEMRKEQREFEVRMGGRTDRSDPADIEDCIFIPMSRFQKEEEVARPLYQTPDNLVAEDAVAALFVAKFGGVFQKLPIAYQLEYAYYEYEGSNLTAWCEVKDRTSGSGYTSQAVESMGGYMLSFHKWLMAYQYALLTHVPFVLAVRLTDGLFTASFTAEEMSTAPVRFRRGGRSDRADWQDQEVCVFIPMALFEKHEVAS